MKKVLLGLLLCATVSMFAEDYYVRFEAGDNEKSGKSWADAWTSIYKAWNAAAPGDNIYMEGGEYLYEGAYVTKGLNFYGSYKVTDVEGKLVVSRNAKEGGKPWEFETETVIKGKGGYRFFDFSSPLIMHPILFDGITFQNGYTVDPGRSDLQFFHGGALRFMGFTNANATVTIRKCQFVDNISKRFNSTSNMVNGYGGAIYSDVDNLLIEDCLFRGNKNVDNINGGGGAVYLLMNYPKRATIKGCTFDSNQTAVNGGAIRLVGDADFFIKNSIFFNNDAHTNQWPEGGALHVSHLAEVDGCLFYNNGGSTLVSAKGGVYRNLTCANNKTNFTINGPSVEVYNSLFYDVAAPGNVVSWWNAEGRMEYCASAQAMTQVNVMNPIMINGVNTHANGANIKRPSSFKGVATSEAQYQELLATDWTLSSASPLISAGLLTLAPDDDKDLAGTDRPTSGTTCAVGAYEYVSNGPTSVDKPAEFNGSIYISSGRVEVAAAEAVALEIYSVIGSKVVEAGASVSHSIELPSGVYLVLVRGSQGDTICKVAVR